MRDGLTPRLTFSPRAWLKWQFLCHAGPTEIGAFGLSSESDPPYVEDLIVLKQSTTEVSVAFDDNAVADLFDEMADVGVPASRFARIWLHTHPGSSVTPSGVDEETFRHVFGHCDWAVMAILGRTGRTSARLRFNAGPGGSLEIPTSVDWSQWPEFALGDDLVMATGLWQQEYERLVEPHSLLSQFPSTPSDSVPSTPPAAGFDGWLIRDDPFFHPELQHESR